MGNRIRKSSDRQSSIVPTESIEHKILLIRGEKVIIDADLAALYGVETRRLNEQVVRNIDRFPADFMFQLSVEEKAEVIPNCDNLSKLRFYRGLPYAFTEHGTIMAASVLNTPRAVEQMDYLFWWHIKSCRISRCFTHQLESVVASNAAR